MNPAILYAMVFIFGLYEGYSVYSFHTDADSDLNQRKTILANNEKDFKKRQQSVKKLEEFKANLEKKKEELRSYVKALANLKADVAEIEDIPGLIKTIAVEAHNVGLLIQGMTPTKADSHEYFTEQSFNIRCKGWYFQIIAFFERLNNLSNIVLADAVTLESQNAKTQNGFPEIDGILQIKTFRYIPTYIDKVSYDENGFKEILQRAHEKTPPKNKAGQEKKS
jgi:Tfp pilus assembly protein PilO